MYWTSQSALFILFIVVLVGITIAMIKHYEQRQFGKERVCLFGLHFCATVYVRRKSGHELKQGKNQEEGADAEAKERSCLLACSLLSSRTQGH